MRNFLITILFCLLISNIAFATVWITEQHILFSYGLSDLDLSKKYLGEGGSEMMVLSGDDLSGVKINDQSQKPDDQNDIRLSPVIIKEMDGYNFWKIKGENKGKNFYIFGYTIRTSDDIWIENDFIIDVIKLLFIVVTISIIGLILRRRK